MEGSGALSDALLVMLAALGITALVARRLAARRGHRRPRTVDQHDPLADLFKGDTLAEIIAELAARRYQPTPHAMLAALRNVWREEGPGQTRHAAIAGREQYIALPPPSRASKRKKA